MSDSDAIPPPPSGFTLAPGRPTGFSAHNGPYFDGPEGETVQRAFFSLQRHANGLGLVHGGMLTSFMDALLAGAVGRATGKISMTMHLSVDFLHMARVGEWLIGEARVTRHTPDVGFAEGCIRIAGRDVVRATGIFKLMQRRG